jgi:hypothetical protein
MTSERSEAITIAPEAVQLALPLDREAPRTSQGRRSIEADFPVLEVSRLAQLESYRKNIYRPAYYIHKWWSGRLGSMFRMLILAAFVYLGKHREGICLQDAVSFL